MKAKDMVPHDRRERRSKIAELVAIVSTIMFFYSVAIQGQPQLSWFVAWFAVLFGAFAIRES